MAETALHTAIIKNDQTEVEELLRGEGKKDVNNAVNGEFPIHAAAKARNNRMVKLLVEAGANVNQAFLQSGSMQGYTALHFAARNGDIDLVQMLHKLGADLNRTANDGWRPIHAAAFGGKRQAMLSLLDCGAEIDATNPQGHTALTYCVNSGRAADVRELANRGAKTDITDKLGDTPLHHAFHYRMSKLFEGEYDVPDVQLDVAVLLALQGIDVEKKNYEGEVGAHFLLDEDEWPSINKFLKVISHNAEHLQKSKIEWNYMTFVGARVEVLAGLGLELKHCMDLVELAAAVDRERISSRKNREEARASQGGCPVMAGKKKKKGGATPAETGASSATNPFKADAHAGFDMSKADPNGPDPSGGQCPFFKKNATAAAGPPVGATTVAAHSTPSPSSVPPAATAPATSVAAHPPVKEAAPATTRTARPPPTTVLEFVQRNQTQVLGVALAFFLGIWFEQMMQRLFGR